MHWLDRCLGAQLDVTSEGAEFLALDEHVWVEPTHKRANVLKLNTVPSKRTR